MSGEDTPGNVFDLVLRNTGIVDWLWLFPLGRYEFFKETLRVGG